MLKRVAVLGIVLPLFAMAGACRGPTSVPSTERHGESAWFGDITADVGLAFVHDVGPLGQYFMSEIVGSGAALFDFDRDGRRIDSVSVVWPDGTEETFGVRGVDPVVVVRKGEGKPVTGVADSTKHQPYLEK